MKMPKQLESQNIVSATNSDEKSESAPLHPAVWASVNGVWGSGGNVILHDAAVCTRPGDHVTCLSTGVCHATTLSSTVNGCSVHVNNTGAWGANCPHPLPAADVAHATALWNDFDANYTGRRV